MFSTTDKPPVISQVQKHASTTWFAAAILFLLTFIVFSQFILSDQMLFSSDQMNGLDNKMVLQQSILKHRQFPMWFSSRLSGMPTIDALFGDAFYPPSILISMVTSIPRSIGYKMIFHVFLAGLFFYLLLRKGFRMNQLVSITGGLFYMFNPQFFTHIYPGHDGKMYVIAWLPFIIWQVTALMRTPALANISLAGLGIGMALLSSQIQMTYFVLWGAFLYWATATGISICQKDRPPAFISRSLAFWGAVGLGLCIGAIQIFPSILYIKDAFSVRGVERGFEYAASWSLHWPELFSLWVPEFANSLDYYWGQNPFKLNSEYAGMLPLLLSAGALMLKPKKPWRIFWAAVAISIALFSLGAHTPVFHIAYAIIPGVKKFRAASMLMFWFSFSTIFLSALFLKDIASGFLATIDEKRKKNLQKGLFITAGAFIAITLLFSAQGIVRNLFTDAVYAPGRERIFEANFSRNFLPFLWLWLIFSLGTIGLIIAALKGKISAPVVVCALLCLGLVDTLRVDAKFIKLITARPYLQREDAVKQLSDEMVKTPFRCYSLPGALPQNGEGIYGLEGVGGFHDNELHWYRNFRGDQQDRNFLSTLVAAGENGQPYLRSDMLTQGNPFLNIANAKYLLVRSGTRLIPFENRNALARLSYVQSDTIMDSSAVPEALMRGTYDYRRTVALSSKPILPEGFSAPSADAPTMDNAIATEWRSYTPNFRKAEVTIAADGFLRIAEVFYPGWEIRLDGKKVPYYRADLSWIALPVTKGKHTVEMLPHSWYLSRFFGITCAATLAIAGFWLVQGFNVVRSRKKH